MLDTVKERLKYFLKEYEIKGTDFCQAIGVSSGFIAGMRESIQPDKLKSIAIKYPILSIEWLMTGGGEMLKSSSRQDNVIRMDNPNIMYVPLVSQYAQAGYLSGYGDDEYIESLPVIPFIIDHEARGNYVSFEVRGDSMDDSTDESYKDGDRVLCREIRRHLWVDSKLHHKKWDFIVVHSEGIVLKRIINHDVENHTITIHSLNPEYLDKVINLEDVYQIFNVVEMSRPRRR